MCITIITTVYFATTSTTSLTLTTISNFTVMTTLIIIITICFQISDCLTCYSTRWNFASPLYFVVLSLCSVIVRDNYFEGVRFVFLGGSG